MSLRTPLALAALGVTLLSLTACTGSATTPSTPSASTPSSAETAAGEPGLEDSFAEREQFFRDQQFVRGSTTLSAVTPAQLDFIAEQRAYIESHGAVWSAEYETVYLALTADACETSILNGHALDAATFTTHLQTSPLVATLVDGVAEDQVPAATANLASVMVFGTSFLCPADAPQWEAAYTEVFG